MNSPSNTPAATPTPLQVETAEVDRVAAVLMASAGGEPHARVIAAMGIALSLMGEAYPCCRASLGQVLMELGLYMQAAPDGGHGHHVH